MKLRVTHRISYRYLAAVSIPPQQLLMRPRENLTLSVLRYTLKVEPAAEIFWSRDHRDNAMATLYLWDPVEHLDLCADFDVETRESNPFDFVIRLDAVDFPFEYSSAEAAVLAPYRDTSRGRSRQILPWVRNLIPERPGKTIDLLTGLNAALREQIHYRERPEPGVQSPEETIHKLSGTCRDIAWLMVVACQALGLAARFVSGYLYDPSVPDGSPRGSLHAWTEIYLPGAGWKGFDPTHAVLANDHFIPVAVGRGPENLNPVVGDYWAQEGTGVQMQASIDIVEI